MGVGGVVEGSAAEFDVEVSHPSLIPDIGIEVTPQLEPGQQGWLEMNMTNRYPVPMTNMTLTLEIFEALNENEQRQISKVGHPPEFTEATVPDDASSTINGLKVTISEDYIASNRTRPYSLRIKGHSDTYQATYVIRMELKFNYGVNGRTVVMRSKGHFPDEAWDIATTGDNPDETGNINLTALGVDGIIPDTSFGVRRPFPQWPRYLFLGLAAVALAGGVFLYQVEEKGRFPAVKKKLDAVERKVKDTFKR